MYWMVGVNTWINGRFLDKWMNVCQQLITPFDLRLLHLGSPCNLTIWYSKLQLVTTFIFSLISVYDFSEFSGGSPNCIEILKIHKSDQQLILHLKFCGKLACERFLQGYREKSVHQHIQNQLGQCLKMEHLQVCLELRVDTQKLDTQLDEEEKCLQYILSLKVTSEFILTKCFFL